jgi:hypothetical protein
MGQTAMKNPIKIAINVLASLFVMVSGTMQAVRAEEVWLDFSVPEADVVVTSPSVTSTPKTVPNALNSQRRYYPRGAPKEYEQVPSTTLRVESPIVQQPRPPTLSETAIAQNAPPKAIANNTQAIQPSQKASENTAKRIALDFGVPNANLEPAPVSAGIPAQTEPSNLDVTPPPVKTEVSPHPKPPTSSTVKTPTSKPLIRSKQLTALRRAIIGQESSDRFWLVNPDSGALGYGQLLRENVAPWTKAALGKALTPEEFLANPKLQIKTIDHKINEYLQRELAYTGGNNDELAIRRVASAWYSGNPNFWNNTRPQYSNGRRYPSIASYTRSVWKRYLREIAQG